MGGKSDSAGCFPETCNPWDGMGRETKYGNWEMHIKQTERIEHETTEPINHLSPARFWTKKKLLLLLLWLEEIQELGTALVSPSLLHLDS